MMIHQILGPSFRSQNKDETPEFDHRCFSSRVFHSLMKKMENPGKPGGSMTSVLSVAVGSFTKMHTPKDGLAWPQGAPMPQ